MPGLPCWQIAGIAVPAFTEHAGGDKGPILLLPYLCAAYQPPHGLLTLTARLDAKPASGAFDHYPRCVSFGLTDGAQAPNGIGIGAASHHIMGMAKEHPHAGATCRVVPQEDLTFGVEVSVPGSFPAMVRSFATEQLAEAWIANYNRRITEKVPHRFMRRRSSRS